MRGMALWDRRDGCYEVLFTAQSVGRHTLGIAMAVGREVVLLGGKGMDFQVVPGLPSPEHCVVKGQGKCTAWAGAPAEFVVEARDAAGNLVVDRALQMRVILDPGSNNHYQ